MTVFSKPSTIFRFLQPENEYCLIVFNALPNFTYLIDSQLEKA